MGLGKLKTLRRLFELIFALVVMAVVIGVFIATFNALTPSNDSGGLLVTNTPLPTPASPEEFLLNLYLQQHANDLNAPPSDDGTPVVFSIIPGELPSDVATQLQSQGLVKDADLFLRLAKYLHVDTKIQAGEYVLRRTMTMPEILDAVQHGRAKTITITIRPGWRAEEIADYLAGAGLKNFSKDQFLQSVKNGKFDYAFLRDRPKNALPTIEGFLFPETYNVPFDVTSDTIITLMLETFNQRVTEKIRQEATSSKMTLYEVITLASIVEREGTIASERPLIAGVFLNRLKKIIFLQSDATVFYAMGSQPATRQASRTPVSSDEFVRIDSPYNTYLHNGLPPGPICNPGLASIVAVLEPAQTDFLYFYSKGDGTSVFAKTYEEHQLNVQKYGGK